MGNLSWEKNNDLAEIWLPYFVTIAMYTIWTAFVQNRMKDQFDLGRSFAIFALSFHSLMKIFSDKKDQTSKNHNPRVSDVEGPARPMIEPEICLQIALSVGMSL